MFLHLRLPTGAPTGEDGLTGVLKADLSRKSRAMARAQVEDTGGAHLTLAGFPEGAWTEEHVKIVLAPFGGPSEIKFGQDGSTARLDHCLGS